MSAITIFHGVASTPPMRHLIILPTKEGSSCLTVMRFAFVVFVGNRLEKHTLYLTLMAFIPDCS